MNAVNTANETDKAEALGVVYVVDDDEAVRDSLQWLLEGASYRVASFDSAEAFLAGFDERAIACLASLPCFIRSIGTVRAICHALNQEMSGSYRWCKAAREASLVRCERKGSP